VRRSDPDARGNTTDIEYIYMRNRFDRGLELINDDSWWGLKRNSRGFRGRPGVGLRPCTGERAPGLPGGGTPLLAGRTNLLMTGMFPWGEAPALSANPTT
jgi:hypothetical protein